MRRKTFKLTLYILLILFVSFIFIIDRLPDYNYSPDYEADVLFSDLLTNVDKINTITVKTDVGKIVIKRIGDYWGLPHKGGYPVEYDKIYGLILRTASLTIIEKLQPSRQNWKNYKLGDIPEEQQSRVIFANDEQTILDVIFGRVENINNMYVRENNTDEIINTFADQVPVPRTDIQYWLHYPLLDVREDEIAKITLSSDPEATLQAVEREIIGKYFIVPTDNSEKKPVETERVKVLFSALKKFDFSDVMKLPEGFDITKFPFVKFELHNGIVIELRGIINNIQSIWVNVKVYTKPDAKDNISEAFISKMQTLTDSWLFKIDAKKYAALFADLHL